MKGIGYFLGATFGAAILFFVISFVFLRPRKVSEIEINFFLNNSEKILISHVPLITSFDIPVPDERLGRDIISKTTYFSNKNMSYVRADVYTYFSKELNKYVRTYYIDEIGSNMTSKILDFGDKDKDRTKWPDIYFFYNKIQNEDPSYGTIDKPLPILFFESSDPTKKTFWYDEVNKERDVKLMNSIYEENVKLYLQYFIDKEDFKKLFPKD